MNVDKIKSWSTRPPHIKLDLKWPVFMCGESLLALSQRCSPFLGLFEKARFFRPKQGFLVNIALSAFFTVVVDLPCMSTEYGYRTIAYIGRPLHAHVTDYHSSRQCRLYSIISMSTMMMSWAQWQFYCERSTFCLFQARKEHFISIFRWTQSLSLIVLWQFLLRKEPFCVVLGPKRALYDLFLRDAKGTKGELKKHLWERASHCRVLLHSYKSGIAVPGADGELDTQSVSWVMNILLVPPWRYHDTVIIIATILSATKVQLIASFGRILDEDVSTIVPSLSTLLSTF